MSGCLRRPLSVTTCSLSAVPLIDTTTGSILCRAVAVPRPIQYGQYSDCLAQEPVLQVCARPRQRPMPSTEETPPPRDPPAPRGWALLPSRWGWWHVLFLRDNFIAQGDALVADIYS